MHKGKFTVRESEHFLIRFKDMGVDLKLQHPMPQHKISLIHNSLGSPAQRNPNISKGRGNNQCEIN